MTDQQPHTPTTGFIQSRYEAGRLALDGADTARLTTAERSAEFDRWLATVEAAAEQRGAIKALQESKQWLQNGGWIELNQRITPNGTSDSMAQITVIWLGEQIERYRADQMEGDDETH